MTAFAARSHASGRRFLERRFRLGRIDAPMALLAPFVVGVAIRLLFAFVDNVVGPDESAYLGTGHSIWSGDGITYRGQPQLHFPPLLPIVLGGLARVLPEPHHATVLVTFISGVAAMVILTAIANRIAGRRAAEITLWIVALSPGLSATLSRNAGGSEGPYIAAVFGAALVTIGSGRWEDRPGVLRAFFVGLLVGAAYLLRPEGIPLAGAFGLMLALRAVGGRLHRGVVTWSNVRRVGSLAIAVIAGTMLLAAPYLTYLHHHTGTWGLTAKSVDVNIEAWRALAKLDRATRDTYVYALDASGHSTEKPSYPLTDLARENPKDYVGIVGTNLRQLNKSFVTLNTTSMPGWRIFALPLLFVALWTAWRRRANAGVVALLAVAGLTLATVTGFFVLDRYLPPVVGAFAVLAGVGLADLSDRSTKKFRWWLALGLVGSVMSLMTYFEGAHGPQLVRERRDIQLAARWLRPVAEPGDTIMTRGTSLPYYMPHNRLVVPPVGSVDQVWRYARYNNVKYFIFEPTTQLWRPALVTLSDGRDHTAEGFILLHHFRDEGRPTFIFKVTGRDRSSP